MPCHGYWIICGKDLGLWVVDGDKNLTPIEVPKDKKTVAEAMMRDLFSRGHAYFK